MGPVLESFRFMTVTVKFTTTPSMVIKNQEILRDPTPFSVASRSAGVEGGPACINFVIDKSNFVTLLVDSGGGGADQLSSTNWPKHFPLS